MQVVITYKNDEMYWVDKLCVQNTEDHGWPITEGIVDLSFDDPCDIQVKRYPKTNKLSVTYLRPKYIGIRYGEEDWYFFLKKEYGGKCFLPEEYNKEEYGKIDAKVTFKQFSGLGPTQTTFHVKNNQ